MDSRQCLHWAPYSYWGFTHAAQKTLVISEALQPELLFLCPGRSSASFATAQESPVETLANWARHLLRVTQSCRICHVILISKLVSSFSKHLFRYRSSVPVSRDQHFSLPVEGATPTPVARWPAKTATAKCCLVSQNQKHELCLEIWSAMQSLDVVSVIQHCIYFTLTSTAKQLSLFH